MIFIISAFESLETAGIFPEKISRSGLNHRLKKLSKLAEELRSSRPE